MCAQTKTAGQCDPKFEVQKTSNFDLELSPVSLVRLSRAAIDIPIPAEW